jgi:hypothetical protein
VVVTIPRASGLIAGMNQACHSEYALTFSNTTKGKLHIKLDPMEWPLMDTGAHTSSTQPCGRERRLLQTDSSLAPYPAGWETGGFGNASKGGRGASDPAGWIRRKSHVRDGSIVHWPCSLRLRSCKDFWASPVHPKAGSITHTMNQKHCQTYPSFSHKVERVPCPSKSTHTTKPMPDWVLRCDTSRLLRWIAILAFAATCSNSRYRYY